MRSTCLDSFIAYESKMSATKKEYKSCLSRSRSLYCKVCHVACLSNESLHLHYEGTKHKLMEENSYGHKMGDKWNYCSLEDFINSPKRKEPLVGLQYTVQLQTYIGHSEAFMCIICKRKGPLYFIMRHLTSTSHRLCYFEKLYDHLFPLFDKNTPYYERHLIVREHAKEIEHQGFWKCNARTKRKLNYCYDKALNLIAQKESVLKYMETFKLASQEEAGLLLNLKEDIKAAVQVFVQNSKGNRDTSPLAEQFNVCRIKISTSTSGSQRHSTTEDSSTPAVKSDDVFATDKIAKHSTKATKEVPAKSGLEYQNKISFDFKKEKWDSLLKNEKCDQTPTTSFSPDTKGASLFSNSPLNITKANTLKKSSTESQSSYTLFSQSDAEKEHQLHAAIKNLLSMSKVKSEYADSSADIQNGGRGNSQAAPNSTLDLKTNVTPVKITLSSTEVSQTSAHSIISPVQQNDRNTPFCNPVLKTFELNHSDDDETLPRHPDVYSKHMKTDDGPLPSSAENINHEKASQSKQLTPEMLHFFKGKDVNTVVEILTYLTTFYPALKQVNLEIFARILSEVGNLD
ncbi:LOW QUALITY PROTEIN: uncharacterized protein LOC128661517 [Bombina bombina]|uniref:LOW QUALITY PROTEIN: uncharacterized protein LOC128661517 n=1 Tax=Bombina bombina TaxID=8345 RepID=UPI00235A49E6|nr:LOW QUALITY PROTEIN: uncharacterized protein LOC128661517 [Bombina bombina]